MTLLDLSLLRERLGLQARRFDVDALAECDSTNSELMRRADNGAPSGSVVVADRQSAGRGRRGRSWLSEPARSLTFSVLWRFASRPDRLAGLSLAAGVALARALENLGGSGIALKWPNDLILQTAGGHAKLAGILVELSTDRRGTVAVIGIGLNLEAPSGDLPQAAAGLAEAMVRVPERHVVLAETLGELVATLDAFAVDGFAGQKSAWLARHAWQDRPVRVFGDGGAQRDGVCRGADDDGALLLEHDGKLERIHAGDVSLRSA
jgi:BirA family biotin operon repressor/biotin-[acetyl-CoA-carboxylase] ligase